MDTNALIQALNQLLQGPADRSRNLISGAQHYAQNPNQIVPDLASEHNREMEILKNKDQASVLWHQQNPQPPFQLNNLASYPGQHQSPAEAEDMQKWMDAAPGLMMGDISAVNPGGFAGAMQANTQFEKVAPGMFRNPSKTQGMPIPGKTVPKEVAKAFEGSSWPTELAKKYSPNGNLMSVSKKLVTPEQAEEITSGWKIPGLRQIFDTAMQNKDAEGVRALLPVMPKEYLTKFAEQIIKVAGKM